MSHESANILSNLSELSRYSKFVTVRHDPKAQWTDDALKHEVKIVKNRTLDPDLTGLTK